jgi:hypothetical protein
VLVCWVLCWERGGGARWFNVDEPHSIGGVPYVNDRCDAVLDDTGIVFVQEDVISSMITQLTKGYERFLQFRLDRSLSGPAAEFEWEVEEIYFCVVRRLHDLSIGNTNA